jgi:hypothetical protein
MSIGSFKEINESNEVNETRENTDNTEKPRSQILETPESYDDDFDSKLDSNDRKNASQKEGHEQEGESDGEKTSLFDKMRNLFSKKENGEESEPTDNGENKSEENDNERNSSFLEDLKKDTPSLEEQAENAKALSGREDYLEAREKSEQVKRDYPDLKDWELSPEQLSEVRQGQPELGDGTTDIGNERKESTFDESRTPGGDAWERRFGNIEGDE